MDAVYMLYKSFDSDAPWQKGALRREAHRKYRQFVVGDSRYSSGSDLQGDGGGSSHGETGMRFFRVRN